MRYVLINRSKQSLSLNVRDERGNWRGVHLSPRKQPGCRLPDALALTAYELTSSNVKKLISTGEIVTEKIEMEQQIVKKSPTPIVVSEKKGGTI